MDSSWQDLYVKYVGRMKVKPLNCGYTDKCTLTLTYVYYYTGDLKKEGTFNSYFQLTKKCNIVPP